MNKEEFEAFARTTITAWRNKKNGILYKIENTCVLNATNENNGQQLILYKNYFEEDIVDGILIINKDRIYVRETKEFFEKFIPVYVADLTLKETERKAIENMNKFNIHNVAVEKASLQIGISKEKALAYMDLYSKYATEQ